ncbi:MAG: hypothetical protein R3183_00790 [Oleiphilaceae bacterium]|nr:hypothetical protein [Oleiphilaceae bacterium]
MNPKKFTLAAAVLLFVNSTVWAELSLVPGNILVSSQNVIFEYTPSGDYVSQMTIPVNEASEAARDFTMTAGNGVAVFNGTFNPQLSVFEEGAWQHSTIAGWSTPNNLSYGGIAVVDDMVFLTDGSTAYAQERGIIRYSLETGAVSRFINNSDYIDITLGQDGKLYALRNSYGDLDIIDPISLAVLASLDLGHTSGSRGVTADADGNIYMTSWNGFLAKYDVTGNQIASLPIPGSLYDIDITGNGSIVIASRSGSVYLTSVMMDSFTEVLTLTGPVFVAFVEQALPGEPALSGSSYRKGRWINTTLDWQADVSAIDVYLNGVLLETVTNETRFFYRASKHNSQVYKVCNAGTPICSDNYRAN